MTTTPLRTTDQRFAALSRAQEVRIHRARMKRDLHNSTLENAAAAAIGYLAKPPTWLETMHARDLILAIPKIGPSRVDRLLTATQTSPRKTITGLSRRQRQALITWLRLFAATHTMEANDV